MNPNYALMSDDALNELRRKLQGFLQGGLVTVVGSGLSIAEGLPSMADLAVHLSATVPLHLDTPACLAAWDAVNESMMQGCGLEEALKNNPPPPSVERAVVYETGALVRAAELDVMTRALQGEQLLRLTRLLKHFPEEPQGTYLVTTNYDRLVEVAVEMTGHHVDTQFCGGIWARHAPRESRFAAVRGIRKGPRSTSKLEWARRFLVLKPHGSIDWYRGPNGVFRVAMDVGLTPEIITPGLNKYRAGYEVPFDHHRGRANEGIDSARALLFIGYGFNDDHLETHIRMKLERGAPYLILSRGLTPNAQKLLKEFPHGIAMIMGAGINPNGTTDICGPGGWESIAGNAWDVAGFVDTVMEF